MADNRLRFNGLDELRRDLQNLPEHLAAQARAIVQFTANGAAADVREQYPSRTGRLRGGVRVTHQDKGRFTVAAIVKNSAPHAWLYDNGSALRHRDGGGSTGRMWGRSKPPHTFVRTMARHRAAMSVELKAIVASEGLKVVDNGPTLVRAA